MSASFYDLLKYAATGIASPDMSYFDKMRASTLMGGVVKTLTGIPPLSFKSDGNPLISWSMKGNGSQSGTPTPDNPVMPTFCGVRTVNVCPPAAAETKTNNGITAVSNGSGTYHVSGTATADADIRFDVPSFLIPISIAGGGSGTYSMFNSAAYNNVYVKIVFYYRGTKVDDWGLIRLNRNDTNYRAMGGKDCDAIGFTVKSGVTVDFTISPEFTDDRVLPSGFEPFGWAEKITCAGQTVPVYLGQTQTVRRINKIILTGDENFYRKNDTNPEKYLYYFTTEGSHYPKAIQDKNSVCTHLKWGAYISRSFYISENGNIFYINFGSAIMNAQPSGNTDAGLKEYLSAQYAAGHPVTVWYVLATEQTGIVNEPLAKIGDYADELHSTDAAVTIPTIKGQNTLTVDTPIQPSEMTITFKG